MYDIFWIGIGRAVCYKMHATGTRPGEDATSRTMLVHGGEVGRRMLNPLLAPAGFVLCGMTDHARRAERPPPADRVVALLRPILAAQCAAAGLLWGQNEDGYFVLREDGSFPSLASDSV